MGCKAGFKDVNHTPDPHLLVTDKCPLTKGPRLERLKNHNYSAIKKNEITLFTATWVDLEIILLNEVSQKEKEKHHVISLICGI